MPARAALPFENESVLVSGMSDVGVWNLVLSTGITSNE